MFPTLNMISDKWNEDVLPVLQRTRYAKFLPKRGGGSRGGRVSAIRFSNGATLRWMTGGGGDKTVAGFTARILLVTETDGFATAKASSDEADRLRQLEGRTRAFKDRRQVYHECTVTTEDKPTWSDYQSGSAARIMTPCPHCRGYVAVEREHLVGWKEAENEEQARELAHWICPACGQIISEDERIAMNRAARLVHRGQEITSDGVIHGTMPHTRTLGFRWSAFHNLFIDAAELGAEEWKALHAASDADKENAEKALCQFIWCLPYSPTIIDEERIEPKKVQQRVTDLSARMLPADTERVTIGIDIGKWTSWFLLMAARAGGAIHIADYGVIEVHSDQWEEEIAIYNALREFAEVVYRGWPMADASRPRIPDAIWIDAGYKPKPIHQFVKKYGTYPAEDARWFASLGRGETAHKKQIFRAPSRRTNLVRRIGDGWFLARAQAYNSANYVFDADAWKLAVQAGLRAPMGEAGALSLFDPGPDKDQVARHNKLAHHFAAEQRRPVTIEGRGTVLKWFKNGQVHWLDCAANARAALSALGFDPGGKQNANEETPADTPATAEDWWKQQSTKR